MTTTCTRLPPPDYAPCTRHNGHDGPCALPLRPEPLVITIVRGLPGSGKSRYSKLLAAAAGAPTRVISTDDYFMADGLYLFNPKEIGAAHAWNQQRCQKLMERGERGEHVIVDNTNTCLWEMREYVRLARAHHYKLFFMEMSVPPFTLGMLETFAARNTHGVPLATIKAMASRWEPLKATKKSSIEEAILAAKAPWEK